MIRSNSGFFAAIIILFAAFAAAAQERLGTYQIRIAPDKDGWTYELNQPAKFNVAVTLDGNQVSGLPIKYACGLEAMKPTLEKSVTTTNQSLMIDAGTLKEPGFLRCIVTLEKDGKSYRGLATAGFRPDLIKPTTGEPKDFDAFWNESKKELAKLPIDAKFEPLPNYSTSTVEVFQVNFQNVGTGISKQSRIYGILAVPKTTNPNQKFPALLNVPGAGVRSYRGVINLAERGIITLQIGIHGLPVTLNESVYDDLRAGSLNRYMLYNLDNKDTYYYKRVFLGCIRANDFLISLPQFDGKNLGILGGSQGGALAISTTALDNRVRYIAASYPALSDVTGYIYGRAGGWHHGFKDEKNRTPEKIETSKYYDTVNFAKRLKVAGIYSFGYNDEVCPPTSMFAAFNQIAASKKLLLGLEQGHSNSPEQTERINKWLEDSLKSGKTE
ncbi:MAG: acetylxylan esterase [Pyrinomonadaceae bacterium]|nr:acetylxylan esterase [Pyrinomonadaceae bacterium]